MPGEQNAIEVLRRWRDHGAVWEAVELSDRHVVVELRTCYGEPVDRLESRDPAVISYVRDEAADED